MLCLLYGCLYCTVIDVIPLPLIFSTYCGQDIITNHCIYSSNWDGIALLIVFSTHYSQNISFVIKRSRCNYWLWYLFNQLRRNCFANRVFLLKRLRQNCFVNCCILLQIYLFYFNFLLSSLVVSFLLSLVCYRIPWADFTKYAQSKL